jgi:hypothetical protein
MNNFYADFRIRSGLVPSLRDNADSPPENLLQAVWQHQRIRRDELKTPDGTPVRILHPGFRSVEGGPDFRGAVIQIGNEAPASGDVEVDIRASGWRAHGHDINKAFTNVILHVIWGEEPSAAGGPPTIALRNVLDAPIGELNLWLGTEAAQEFPEMLRGKCCAPLRELDETATLVLLREAAKVRLQSKASQFQARARQAGWEQALWEGIFRALGYKHNTWPMQRIAELRARWSNDCTEPLPLQARLLGIGGLLPPELTRSQKNSDTYLRRIWDHWWRERDAFADCVMPTGLWRFHGLRPANHPQRRLALASQWFLGTDLAARLEAWCAEEITDRRLVSSLLRMLQVPQDEFWSWHCTFRSARFPKAQPLIGETRATDLAINVILPWLWIRAVEGKNKRVQEKIEHRYFAWPPAEDNSLLRLARQRLLAGAGRRSLTSAAAQQGLMQIVRDFCERSNALCDNCKFPELVQQWRSETR